MPRKTSKTLTDAADEYFDVRSIHLAATTLANQRSVIRGFVQAMGPQSQCHAITQRQVELWFAGEAKRQQPSSYNKVRTAVSGFMGFCQRRGWMTENVMGEIRPLRVMKKERMRLSPADLLHLPTHATNARDRAFITIAINTALRASSIVSLRIGDVDLAAGNIRVTIHKTSEQGHLPITSELDAALRTWFAVYEEDAGVLQADWYLTPQRQPGHGREKDDQGRWVGGHKMRTTGALLPHHMMKNPAEIVQRALRSQGHHVEKGEGVHTLRRSSARAYFDKRIDAGYDGALRETSAYLFHASSMITEQYLGLTTERLGLDKALRGQSFLGVMVSDDDGSTPIRKPALAINPTATSSTDLVSDAAHRSDRGVTLSRKF